MNGIIIVLFFDIILKVIWNGEVSKLMFFGYDGIRNILGLKRMY